MIGSHSQLDLPLTAGHQVQPGRAERPWLIYRVTRWATLSLRLLVIWWPLAPVWTTGLLLGPVAMTLTIALAGVGLASRRWRCLVVRRLRRSLEGTYDLGWRALWPKVCGLAGLTFVLAHRTRVPQLVSVGQGPGLWPTWTTLTVRPLGAQDPNVWDQIEDRLKRVTKHAASLSWQDPTGALIIRLFRHALPEILPVDPALIGNGRDDHVTLGQSIEGDSIVWSVDDRPHLAVVGVTGGGKGIILRLVLAHAVAHGWVVNVLNPKRSGEYGWLKTPIQRASIAKTLNGMAAMVAATHDEMQTRQDLIETAGVDTWHQVPELTDRVLLILDESASLIGTGNKGEDVALRRVIAGQLAAIVAMGRSAGVHVVIVTQHGIADSFGPSGSTMKANTSARIVVGSSPPEGLRMMFGPDLGPAATKALSAEIPGRCLYQGLDPTKGARVTLGQIFYAQQHDLAGLTTTTPTPWPVPDYDHQPADQGDTR